MESTNLHMNTIYCCRPSERLSWSSHCTCKKDGNNHDKQIWTCYKK